MDSPQNELKQFAFERSTLLVTYEPNATGDGVPVALGTGFFMESGGRVFVVTNTHVLEKLNAARAAGRTACTQVVGARGEKGVEEHNGYLLMPQKLAIVDGVSSEHDHLDIGLIEIKPEFVPVLAKAKKFLTAADANVSALEVGQDVFYRGYPLENVEFHRPIQSVAADGFGHITKVLSVHDRLVQLDRRERKETSDSGDSLQWRDLHGISGSPVLDSNRKLRGVVWGGDEGTERIFVCPATTVFACIEHYVPLHPSKKRG